jgi:hypothetical protein
MPEVPVIENIHQKIAEQINALEMSQWHSPCGTTHCRAGWVVELAGEQGKALEKATSTPFAAMCIYKVSSARFPEFRDFYTDNEIAKKSILEFAGWEKEQK